MGMCIMLSLKVAQSMVDVISKSNNDVDISMLQCKFLACTQNMSHSVLYSKRQIYHAGTHIHNTHTPTHARACTHINLFALEPAHTHNAQTHTHTHVRAHRHTWTHTRINTQAGTMKHAYTSRHTHKYRTHTHHGMHTVMCTKTRLHVHAHTHACACTHTHTHTHIAWLNSRTGDILISLSLRHSRIKKTGMGKQRIRKERS